MQTAARGMGTWTTCSRILDPRHHQPISGLCGRGRLQNTGLFPHVTKEAPSAHRPAATQQPRAAESAASHITKRRCGGTRHHDGREPMVRREPHRPCPPNPNKSFILLWAPLKNRGYQAGTLVTWWRRSALDPLEALRWRHPYRHLCGLCRLQRQIRVVPSAPTLRPPPASISTTLF